MKTISICCRPFKIHRLLAISCLLIIFTSSWAIARSNSVTVCHIPEEDPGAKHTIMVNVNAADAHLKHGDTLGACIDCSSTEEICDGIDNNCNGLVDETFPDLGQDCEIGIGTCARVGKTICGAFGGGTTCDVVIGSPTDEVCDGLDNNCDGVIDEDLQCSGVSNHCGTITQDETWSPDREHVVTCNVNVVDGASLTIEAGALVKMTTGASLQVGVTSASSIHILGSANSPIIITSSKEAPVPGDWDSIKIGSLGGGSSLEYVDISYCGQVNACVVLDGISPWISNSVIQFSASRGIYTTGTSFPYINDTFISDNNGNGIDINPPGGLDGSILFNFIGNTITGNNGYPIGLPPNAAGNLDISSSFSGNQNDFIRVSDGTIDKDVTWVEHDVPYRVAGDITVGGILTPVLTIGNNTEIRFEPGSDLFVGLSGSPGGLDASLSRFTSAQSSPTLGDWGGISLGEESHSTLTNVWVEYAGANGLGNLVCNNCDGSIDDSEISYSSHWGIYINNGTLSVSNITYSNNADGDIYPIP